MSELKDRDTQTRVKHEILREYLIKWGSIITYGSRNYYALNPQFRSQFKGRFVYVDYFAYTGVYQENGTPVYGSPVLGIQALDEIKQFFVAQTGGLSPTIAAILIEEDRETFERLLATLNRLGYTDRIKYTENLSDLQDGDIAVIRGDSSQYVDSILKFVDIINPTYSFHFIDPYGIKAVERTNIERIVSKSRADCMINMMLNHISRWISVATKEDLNPTEQAYVGFLDKYFGSGVWRDIANDLALGTINRQMAEELLVDAFDGILRGADDNLTVKQVPLQFQDREQVLYTLFLTTHDPTGAFTMNEILAHAPISEYDYRIEKRRVKNRQEQLSFDFLDQLADQKRPEEPEADIDYLASQIYAACHNRRMTFREVLAETSNTAYFLSDVREALGKLREQELANFDGAPSRSQTNP